MLGRNKGKLALLAGAGLLGGLGYHYGGPVMGAINAQGKLMYGDAAGAWHGAKARGKAALSAARKFPGAAMGYMPGWPQMPQWGWPGWMPWGGNATVV
jgi:hypothetical protein